MAESDDKDKTEEQDLFNETWKKYYKSDTSEKVHHSYFRGHKCSLPQGNSSKDEEGMKIGPLRRCMLYLIGAHHGDIRARRMYRSHATFQAEIQRHNTNYPFSIHPFSRLRLIVEIGTFFTILTTFTVHSIFATVTDDNVYFEWLTKALEAIFFLYILSNFFTGYVDGITSKHVVLELSRIFYRYVTTWFLMDLVFCVGFLTNHKQNNEMDWCNSLTLTKVSKMPTLFTFMFNVLEVIEAGQVAKTTMEITLLLYNYIIWNIIYQFYSEYYFEGTFIPSNPRACSWMTINNIWNSSSSVKLVFATHRAVNMLRQNSNLNLLNEGGCNEIFFIIGWTIAKLLVIHCMLKYTLLLFGLESARAKYFMMSQQVQNYMDQRKFPARIKKKILKFYAVRFQSHFFVESRMMACVSGQLGEDIIMYSGRQLVSQVEFLKHLPRSLFLQIGTKLKLVVFLAGDIIFKIHTFGDCLYFIDKGTVAFYSESGKEICHLEDGNFFGEIALIMKPPYRSASAVAVTNCELFRLDKKDFDSTIACYPTVYEDIKKVAAQRLERTIVMDEHHKAELRIGKDQRVDLS